LAQVCIFIGILNFYCHFLKKIFFALGTRNTPSQHLLDKNVLIENCHFLIPGSVNYKIMQSLLRGFNSDGKASNFYF